jgi:hypothetical protein
MAPKVRSEIRHVCAFKTRPHACTGRLRVKTGTGTQRCVPYMRGKAKNFWPDIQKPLQMENAAGEIVPSMVTLMNQFEVC